MRNWSSNGILRIPIIEEEVLVHKRPVMVEEITIGKRTLLDTQSISETVRREQRTQNGHDPTDYQVFRQHVLALGAPDPGEQEIDDFVGDDFKSAHPARYSA